MAAPSQTIGHEFTQRTDVASASPHAPFRVPIVEEPVAQFPEYCTTQLQILADVGLSRTWVLSGDGWGSLIVVDTPERQRVDDDPYGLDEMAWFDSHLDELRRKFGGQYVAIKDRNVVAAASTAKDLRRLVRERGIEVPLIVEITEEPGPEGTVY